MPSDRARQAKLRKDLGLQDEHAVPDSVLQDEIRRGKEQITDEVRQRLDRGATLSFDSAEADALRHFVKLRVKDRTRNAKNQNPPKTVSHMRRHDFGDEEMNYWRDRMVSALSNIS